MPTNLDGPNKPNGPQRDPRKPGPPPLHQRIFAIMWGLTFLASLIIGSSVESWHGIYVRGPMAILAVISLMCAMFYPAKSVDDYHKDNPDDEDGTWK